MRTYFCSYQELAEGASHVSTELKQRRYDYLVDLEKVRPLDLTNLALEKRKKLLHVI